MSTLSKIKVKRKNERLKYRKKQSRKKLKLKQRNQVKVRIKKLLNIDSFLYAIHEVGHFVVRSILRPDVIFNIKLEHLGGDQFKGWVVRADGKNNDDSFEVAALVSIAGIMAEKFNLDDRVLQSRKAIQDEKNKHLHGDYFNFCTAKSNLEKKWKAACGSEKSDFFAFVAWYVEDIFNSFGYDRMLSMASKLEFNKITVMEPIANSYELNFEEMGNQDILSFLYGNK